MNLPKRISSTGWGDCPADILMHIFKLLDIVTYATLLSINIYWRDIADYYARREGLWPKLAQELMTNKGLTFRTKSVLCWRELYRNSLLWHHVKSANISWGRVLESKNLQYMHVYKDTLIVTSTDMQSKYYKVDAFHEIDFSAEQYMHSFEAVAVRNDANNSDSCDCNAKDGHSNRLIAKLAASPTFKKMCVVDENRCYILDSRQVLWCYKWEEDAQSWSEKTLARYYGCSSSIADVYWYNDDVYLILKGGNIMKLDREGRNFENYREFIDVLDLPFLSYLGAFRRTSDERVNNKMKRLTQLKLPIYAKGNVTLFSHFGAAIEVPSDKPFKVNREGRYMVLECPNLSCAVQHGDVLFLGYCDGKVEICIPKNMVTNGSRPETCIFVHEHRQYADGDPRIMALDLFEMKDSHRLFVATNTHVYTLEISYPEDVRLSNISYYNTYNQQRVFDDDNEDDE